MPQKLGPLSLGSSQGLTHSKCDAGANCWVSPGHPTNASIVEELKIQTHLSTNCARRQICFFGHLDSKRSSGVERLILTGRLEGKRSRGRAPTLWIDSILCKVAGTNIQGSLLKDEDRFTWGWGDTRDITTLSQEAMTKKRKINFNNCTYYYVHPGCCCWIDQLDLLEKCECLSHRPSRAKCILGVSTYL